MAGTLLLDGKVMEEITEAILDMKFMRQTHIDWAEFFERNPHIEATYVATGQWDGAEEHRNIAARYDRVIRLLHTLQV